MRDAGAEDPNEGRARPAEPVASGPEDASEQQPEQEQPVRESTVRPRVRRVPEQTTDDTDRGWGERPDEDEHERWLREQRPPHWE